MAAQYPAIASITSSTNNQNINASTERTSFVTTRVTGFLFLIGVMILNTGVQSIHISIIEKIMQAQINW